MIPTDSFAAMAKGQPLGVITFSIFFGVVVTLIGYRAQLIADFFAAVFEVLMKMVPSPMAWKNSRFTNPLVSAFAAR